MALATFAAMGAVGAAGPADSVVSVIGWNSLAMWSGSGFVVGDGRWVVTCFHVAARKLAHDRPVVPMRLTVISPWSGESVEARVVRTDADSDLALLRLEGPPLPALPLATEDAPEEATPREQPPGPVHLSGFPHLETAADPAIPLRVVTAETSIITVIQREQFPSLVLAPSPGPQKGWSGGPVTLVDTGAVIGVFFALVAPPSEAPRALEEGETPDGWLPHATPLGPLTALLRAAGLDPETLRHPPPFDTTQPPDADSRFQHRMHAIIAAMDDRWDRMEAEVRALLEGEPESASAHRLLAEALAETGRHSAALKEWNAALRRAPEWAILHAGRGETLLALGQTQEGVEGLRQATMLAPDDADLRLRLAMALQRADRWIDAHRALQQALSYSPNHPLVRWELGRSWSRRGHPVEALRQMREALELAADLPLADDLRPEYAAELARAGRTSAAERELRELLRRQPGMPQALLALAALLIHHGRADEGRSLAERVLAEHAEPRFERAARRLLERTVR
jgi:serine protease Do